MNLVRRFLEDFKGALTPIDGRRSSAEFNTLFAVVLVLAIWMIWTGMR